jgi:hypothetical protein
MDIKVIGIKQIGPAMIANVGFFDGKALIFQKMYELPQGTDVNDPLEAILPKVKDDLKEIEATRSIVNGYQNRVNKKLDLSGVESVKEKSQRMEQERLEKEALERKSKTSKTK